MGTYSFRNFDIGKEFKKQFKECTKKKNQFKCEAEVRNEYKSVENGRLHEMATAIHKFIIPLDKDERVKFKKQFKDTNHISEEFAVIEELETI